MRRFVGLTAAGGFIGGFLWAYARSANRFIGNRENVRSRLSVGQSPLILGQYREYKRDYNEMSARIEKGESLYGHSTVPESQLRISHYNSMNSHLFLFAVPWFNFVHHPFHGRDVEEYKRPFKARCMVPRASLMRSSTPTCKRNATRRSLR